MLPARWLTVRQSSSTRAFGQQYSSALSGRCARNSGIQSCTHRKPQASQLSGQVKIQRVSFTPDFDMSTFTQPVQRRSGQRQWNARIIHAGNETEYRGAIDEPDEPGEQPGEREG